MDCLKLYPFYCMDFDHVRGKKKFDIGKAVLLQVTMKELLAEIAKCEIVCANCHRVRTYGRNALRRKQFKQRRNG